MAPKLAQSLCKIIHIDMDFFYAAIEERDRPQYRGQPLTVGGRPIGVVYYVPVIT